MRTDLLRMIDKYSFGGIYLDSDVIASGKLDFLVNTPLVVSFSLYPPGAHEINNALSSAPPKHRLIEIRCGRIQIDRESS